MSYKLDCDTCGFIRETPDEVAAYSLAKEHEAEHTSHFVFMERTR